MITVTSFVLGLVMSLPMIGVLTLMWVELFRMKRQLDTLDEILRGLALLRSQQPTGPKPWDGETAAGYLRSLGIYDAAILGLPEDDMQRVRTEEGS